MSRIARLYCPALPSSGTRVWLDAAAAAHARVLRLRPGHEAELFDGEGGLARASVVSLDERGLEIRVVEHLLPAVPGPRSVLVQALPKAGKLDGIVRMATELGVHAVHLAVSERTEVVLDVHRAAARLDRLARVAREAARQAGRADVPTLHAPAPLLEVAARAPTASVRWVAWEDARGAPPPEARAAEGWIVVGPEGGLDPGEVAALRSSGWDPIGLGPHVLRVETAGPVACALLADRLAGLRSREPTAAGPESPPVSDRDGPSR